MTPCTPHQEYVLKTVDMFFRDAPAAECIEHLNWLLADYLSSLERIRELGGSPGADLHSLAEITYHATRTVTLISKLSSFK